MPAQLGSTTITATGRQVLAVGQSGGGNDNAGSVAVSGGTYSITGTIQGNAFSSAQDPNNNGWQNISVLRMDTLAIEATPTITANTARTWTMAVGAFAQIALNITAFTGTPIINISTFTQQGGSGVLEFAATTGAQTIVGALTQSGGAASINASSNFNTVVNSGTSTGTITIGNSLAGALVMASGAASSITVTSANLSLVTSTSGTLLLTSAGAITATSVGTSSWANSTGSLTLSTTTSGALVLSSAGALTLTSVGSSVWTNSTGSLAISTTTSGTLSVVSAGLLTLTGVGASVWTPGAGATIVSDGTTGIKIGTATSQKLGFYNSTPVVQPAVSVDTTGFVAGSGTASKSDSVWAGASGASAYTVGGIVTSLKALGLLAA